MGLVKVGFLIQRNKKWCIKIHNRCLLHPNYKQYEQHIWPNVSFTFVRSHLWIKELQTCAGVAGAETQNSHLYSHSLMDSLPHTDARTRTHTYTHTHARARAHTHTHTHTHTHSLTHAHTQALTHAHTHTHTRTRTHAHARGGGSYSEWSLKICPYVLENENEPRPMSLSLKKILIV